MAIEVIDPRFPGGLHFDGDTRISRNVADDGYLVTYHIETRRGPSVISEVTLYRLEIETVYYYSGNVTEHGNWRVLEWYEIKQAKDFLREKGYL